MALPILYTFRRCPYAIRARMALAAAGVSCELREVVLKDKPDAMLALSPKGTVPVLQLSDRIIDESLDIMIWALANSSSDLWAEELHSSDLIKHNDGEFKANLDKYKYYDRYPEHSQNDYLRRCMVFLNELERLLKSSEYLLADRPTFIDLAIFPFIRQLAFVDKATFDGLDVPRVQKWLEAWLHSSLFTRVMLKYPQWHPQQDPLITNFDDRKV